MTMHTTTHHTTTRHSVGKRLMACLAIVALQVQTLTPAWAALSQVPLISSAANNPKPNVMLTLDTSWSMIFPYVPEGAFKVNGYTVNFPGFTAAIMHPDDTRYDKAGGTDANKAQGDGGVIPADLKDSSNVFQRQMRSPDVNQLYYDPRQQYKPWLKSKDLATGTEDRFPPADPTKALLDPINGTPVDLTKPATDTEAVWCPDNPTQAGAKLACSKSTKSFSPAVYFLLTAGANPTLVGSYTAYDINTTASFTKHANRTDCTGNSCTQTDELRNYANWFVYYRTRLHVAQASIPESFLTVGNTLRVGWGTIHQGSTTIDGQPTSIVQSGVRDLDATRKADMVNWIRNFKSDNTVSAATAQPKLTGGTPLIGALAGVGEYFKREDKRGPWVNNPALTGGDNSAPLSCRRAYNLLVTDGYYGDTTTVGDQDSTTDGTTIGKNTTNGKTYTYNPVKPYADGKSNTLADVAMKYWKTDLHDDIDNNVPSGKDIPSEDPAFWQHLVQFPIGLGVSGNIPLNDLSNQMAQLTAGTKGWWDGSSTISGTDARRIDDLLHAAVNSRGQYFSAKTSAELTAALSAALSAADPRLLNEGGVGLDGQAVRAGTRKYIPSYDGNHWTGDLKAYSLDANGIASAEPVWLASEKLPAHTDRKLYTSVRTASTTTGELFKFSDLSATNLALIGANTTAALVNYLRGDTINTDGVNNIYRKRSTPLADFINPEPVFVLSKVNLKYGNLSVGGTEYAALLRDKAARRTGVVFQGGNGGFLQGFRDSLSTPVDPTDGQEVYGYAPRGVLSNLYKLAQKNYGVAGEGNEHQFFVDGTLIETDAYLKIGSTSSWRNLLVGTLGAGGKGLYTIDVTNLDDTQPTGLGINSVRWDATLPGTTTPETHVGHIFSKPVVGPLPSDRWVALAGNGYDSSSGRAALLVYDMTDGALQAIPVGASTDTGNGLGGLAVIRDANQIIIGAYAGDLKGNLWRFELRNGQWTVGYGNKPVFTAGIDSSKPQPITATPAVIRHPSGGHMVVFGTGKLLEAADRLAPHDTQSIYGIWDKNSITTDTSTSTAETDVPNVRTSPLMIQQTITQFIPPAGSPLAGKTIYDVTSNPQTTASRGWYLDLDNSLVGQRVIYPVQQILQSNYVLVSSITPSGEAEDCKPAAGSGINLVLPALSGAQKSTPIIDLDGDGSFSEADGAHSGWGTGADGGETIAPKETPTSDGPPGEPGCKPVLVIDTQGKPTLVDPCEKNGLRVLDRVWKRIVNVPQPAATPK